jgi:hypothetical protein
MTVEKRQEAFRISNSKASSKRENVRLQSMGAQRILMQGQTLIEFLHLTRLPTWRNIVTTVKGARCPAPKLEPLALR